MASNMTQRVVFAVVAIPLLLLIVWLGGLPLVLLISVAAGLGARELVEFARHQGVRPFYTLTIVAAASSGGVRSPAITRSAASGAS